VFVHLKPRTKKGQAFRPLPQIAFAISTNKSISTGNDWTRRYPIPLSLSYQIPFPCCQSSRTIRLHHIAESLLIFRTSGQKNPSFSVLPGPLQFVGVLAVLPVIAVLIPSIYGPVVPGVRQCMPAAVPIVALIHG
jgi:hypothetical protein